jgi:hypothetical protein
MDPVNFEIASRLIQAAARLSLQASTECQGMTIPDFDGETASSGKKRPSRSDKRRDYCQGSSLS